MDSYKILGVGENASKTQIKKAYLNKIKEFPPEKDPAKFKQIRAAYETIKDNAAGDIQSLRMMNTNEHLAKVMLGDLKHAIFPKLTMNDMIRLTF